MVLVGVKGGQEGLRELSGVKGGQVRSSLVEGVRVSSCKVKCGHC